MWKVATTPVRTAVSGGGRRPGAWLSAEHAQSYLLTDGGFLQKVRGAFGSVSGAAAPERAH